jgi:dethiobiotin synthetase
MSRGLFIAGTDTGVGKTFVAAALLRALGAAGRQAIGMKPVAAGIAPGATMNADVAALRNESGLDAPPGDVNPYGFGPAIAPHAAAARAGLAIDLEAIAAAYERLAKRADAVVVEGAGGVLVPLGARIDMLDVAARLRIPVLLVVGIRLGCINHALLSALAVAARGTALAGWVANRVDPEMEAPEASVVAIAERLPAPLVADIAFVPRGAPVPPLPREALRTLGWS